MAAVSLAMPTKLWDSAGRECGRAFLYLRLKLFPRCDSTSPLFCFHGGSPCYLIPQTHFLAALAARHRRVLQMSEQIV